MVTKWPALYDAMTRHQELERRMSQNYFDQSFLGIFGEPGSRPAKAKARSKLTLEQELQQEIDEWLK